MGNSELIRAVREIETVKKLDGEVLFEAIEASLVAACKKNFGAPEQEVRAVINRETGQVNVYAQKVVVDNDDIYDNLLEIELVEAQKINHAFEVGDICDVEVTPKDFGRIAAQAAKQIVVQKIREAEREKTYNEYKLKEGTLVNGIVQRYDRNNIIVELERIDVVLPRGEQVQGEVYQPGERIKLLITSVEQTPKGPKIFVSRASADYVRKLYEQNVPEIQEGQVEIRAVAREAGARTKIAVYSNMPYIDPIGACIGQNGVRAIAISKELHGEKVDIVLWNDDTKLFVIAALNPAQVTGIVMGENGHAAKVVVHDRQLSLAIGAGGQNVRLAARLTSCKIDIKGEKEAALIGFLDEEAPPLPEGDIIEVVAKEVTAESVDENDDIFKILAENAARPKDTAKILPDFLAGFSEEEIGDEDDGE